MLFTQQGQERLLTQLQHFNVASVVSLTSGSGSLVGGGALKEDSTVQVCDATEAQCRYGAWPKKC